MSENWLDRLEDKFGKYKIPNLMAKIVVMMGLVYFINYICVMMYNFSIIPWLVFNRNLILHGQIWRLITFIFVPDSSSLLMVIIALYFNYVIGDGLESYWGSFKFNAFYFCGILGAILAGFITGYTTNSYLNLSLFIAFAFIYPDFEVLLFYILPIKVKYLAILDGVYLCLMFISNSFAGKLALIVALANVLIFSSSYLKTIYKNKKRKREWENNFKD